MKTIRADMAKRLRMTFLLLPVLFGCWAGTSSAAEFFLRADTTTKVMPDGRAVTMWGFAQDSAFGALDGAVKVPGPRLVVPPGDTTLTIHLDNNLPEPVSIVIPGQIAVMVPVWTDGTSGPRTGLTQRVRSLTHETPSGNAAPVDYTWTNLKPGTYLYQSGTHQAVQVQMGLYGAMTADFALRQAYAGTGSGYTRDVVLLFSEIDPALHDAVAGGTYGTPPYTSTIDYNPKYFLINGTAFSSRISAIRAVQAGKKALLRFLNAGLETHVPTLEGYYMKVIAEDGKLYPYFKNQYSVLLPAGKTMDATFIPSETGYVPLYDRTLYLTNNGASPGGMLAFLDVYSLVRNTLTVTKAGTGGGRVEAVSAPGGIYCGGNCSEVYNAGTTVRLTATPSGGSSFTGWSGGGCTGTGDCTVTMNANLTVTATFGSVAAVAQAGKTQ